MTSSLHQHTPSLTVIDPRGLSVRGIAYHRREVEEAIAARVQRQVFNAQGHLVQQWDPRLLELSESEAGIQPNQSTRYSLNAQVLLTESVDAGWRLICQDAAELLRDSWDGRDTHRRYTYDELMRPVNVFELEPPLCVERFTYAGADEEDARHNRCGKLIRHDDQAGSLWHEAFALTGQPLTEIRRFSRSLMPPNWPESEADLEDKTYTTHWRHDALGAVIEQIDALEHVQRFEVDVAGQPFASWLDGAALLKSTTYNALGRVEIEQAGNDVTTTAYYSARDGRLSNLKAKRSDGKTLQDLHYQYDPIGNITRIEDLAQPVQWFAGQRIQAVSTYAYDTLYQLISAIGRENACQTLGPGLPGLEIFGPIDESRWRAYNQTYSYDSGGNLTHLKHEAGASNTCIREMAVDARSNRSLFMDGSPVDFAKGFDANGNQQYLARGQCMQWDTRNQLQQVTQVQRDVPDGQDDDTETYVYDGSGQRVRKVRRAKTRGGEHINEVRYLPGLEIRSRTSGEQLHVVIAQAGRNGVRLLHWEDGGCKEIANDQRRYSLSDHLGSSTLELDQTGELLSQESYYPYGGTAWWAAKSAIEAKYKVIRYSGKERDATGLYYYGFRYYAPWLQRWINPDPAGNVDGSNLYIFVSSNPMTFKDGHGEQKIDVNSLTEEQRLALDFNSGWLSPSMELYNAGQYSDRPETRTREVDTATFESLKQASFSNMVTKVLLNEGAPNQVLDLWRARIQPIEMKQRLDNNRLENSLESIINNRVGQCGEHSHINFYLLASTETQMPVFRVNALNMDHQFVVIGDHRELPAHELVIADAWPTFPLPHTAEIGAFSIGAVLDVAPREALPGYDVDDCTLLENSRVRFPLQSPGDVSRSRLTEITRFSDLYMQLFSMRDDYRGVSYEHDGVDMNFDMLPASYVNDRMKHKSNFHYHQSIYS